MDEIWGGMKIGIVGAIFICNIGAIIGGWVFDKIDLQIISGWWDTIRKIGIGQRPS